MGLVWAGCAHCVVPLHIVQLCCCHTRVYDLVCCDAHDLLLLSCKLSASPSTPACGVPQN
jgi:hypothetical protein